MSALSWSRRANRDLARLDRQVRERILAALDRLAETGSGDIRRLEAIDPPVFRLRVGKWRVLYAVIEGETILVLRALPRGKAYQKT